MNIKLKEFFALAAIAIAPLPQAGAQNTNQIAGTVVSWGSIVIPQVAPGTRFTKIAAGGAHNLALASDGSVIAWGIKAAQESNIPDGLNGVVAIAAGFRHSLALKSDGTVVGWGQNSFGERAIPTGLNGIIGIAAGEFHSLLLKSNGTIVALGNPAFAVPSGLTGVVAIAE